MKSKIVNLNYTDFEPIKNIVLTFPWTTGKYITRKHTFN